jgi:hypothetical protein
MSDVTRILSAIEQGDPHLRLVGVEKAQHWDSRRHFFAAAAEAIDGPPEPGHVGLIEQVFITVRSDVRTFSGKGQCGGAADASGRAGHNGDLPSKASHGIILNTRRSGGSGLRPKNKPSGMFPDGSGK